MNCSALLGGFALISLTIGPPSANEELLMAELCGGGTIAIPIGDSTPEKEPPCSAGACHAVNCRKSFDPDQRRKGNPPPSG